MKAKSEIVYGFYESGGNVESALVGKLKIMNKKKASKPREQVEGDEECCEGDETKRRIKSFE